MAQNILDMSMFTKVWIAKVINNIAFYVKHINYRILNVWVCI